MLELSVAAFNKSFLPLFVNNVLAPSPDVAPNVRTTVSITEALDTSWSKISLPIDSLANLFKKAPLYNTGSSSITTSLKFSLAKSFTFCLNTSLLNTVFGFKTRSLNVAAAFLLAVNSFVFAPAKPENNPSKLARPFPYNIALSIASSSERPACINWLFILFTSVATELP